MTKTLEELVNEALTTWNRESGTLNDWIELVEMQQARIKELEDNVYDLDVEIDGLKQQIDFISEENEQMALPTQKQIRAASIKISELRQYAFRNYTKISSINLAKAALEAAAKVRW